MTDVDTLTIAEFLLARIAEDEAVARAATPGPWYALDGGVQADLDDGGVWPVASTETDRREREDRVHIARFHPARVLAECEAKRKIVELHRWTTTTNVDIWVRDWTVCFTCHAVLDAPEGWPEDKDWHYPLIQQPWPCPTLRALAVAYADHPDYRDEWKP